MPAWTKAAGGRYTSRRRARAPRAHVSNTDPSRSIPRRFVMHFIPKAGLALLGAVFALTAQAQELTGTLKKVKDTGAITIGYRESSIPFSYLNDQQQPIGYAMDLCMRIVDAVKTELKMPNLKVNL